MTTSPTGIALIQHFENCYLKAYQCAAGVWTIGWGTVEYPDKRPVKQGDTCTQLEANTYFESELKQKEIALTALLQGVNISQLQFDALMSFCYNLGIGAFASSTLYRKIKENPQNMKEICGNDTMDYRLFGQNGQFLRWHRVNKQPNTGLIRRRKAEAWLYSTGMNRFFEEMLADKMTEARDYV